MTSTILLPSRAQLCIRYCSNKHTHPGHTSLQIPLHQPPWSFGFDSQTRGTRENRAPPCVKVPGSSRVPVRDGQTGPHWPRLVVCRSTCPPISPPPPRKQLCTRSCSNKHTPVIHVRKVKNQCTAVQSGYRWPGLGGKKTGPDPGKTLDNQPVPDWRVEHEQSRTRCSQAAVLRINLNVEVCDTVATPVHAPSRAPLLLPLLLSHNLPLPRVY
jgi:hypothetical protein